MSNPKFKQTTVIPAPDADKAPEAAETVEEQKADAPDKPREIGGPKGPEPTRYGDWEHKGRCIDF